MTGKDLLMQKIQANSSQKVSDITIILDRSGSMQSIKDATIEGINNFIKEVQKTPGEGCWSLIQFDTPDNARGAGEAFPQVLWERVPDNKVPLFEPTDFQPRGGTALVDAVCITVERTKERFLSVEESLRPRILIVIVTDGEENSSRQYTTVRLRELTAEVQSKYGWQFLYLGANQDAFAESGKYGVISPMNYTGLQGVATSGQPLPGQSLTTNSATLPFAANAAGVQQCFGSGSVGARAWKADGNQSAVDMLTGANPDAKN